MKKRFFAGPLVCLALSGSLRAQPSPGVVYDLHDQFDIYANPSITGWQYSESLGNGGGVITPTVFVPNWNAPDFGAGQPGWQGGIPGAHAGYAQRIDNGTIGNTPNGNKDAPVGTIMTHGPTSVLLKIPPSDPGGIANINGSLWNLRQFGRSGAWNLYHNDTTLITYGTVDDSVGSSAAPYDFTNAVPGAAPLTNIAYAPGDTFRLELLEGDFQGLNFRVTTFTDPYIIGQPQSPAVYETGGLLLPPGSSTSLSVTAGGVTPVKYQWKLNGSDVPGATNSVLAITNLSAANSGVYTVVVSDSAGQITSTPAGVGLADLYIVSPPLSQSVGYLGSASFSVAAGGVGTLTYKWRLNDVELTNSAQISGATTAMLTITNATTNLTGQITVVVGNGTRSITSQPATFTVFGQIPVFPGIAYDLAALFDTNTTISPSGWEYCEGLAFDGQNGINPGGSPLVNFDLNWNQGDFGPGQPGWAGVLPGPWAGWAKRIDNGTIGSTPNGNKDAPLGCIVGYRNSAVWVVPGYLPSGTLSLAGGIWNSRHFGRSGTWRIYHNDGNNSTNAPLTQSTINDAAGSSKSPYSFERGSAGPAALQNIPYGPGDTFRIDSDEDDFVGWQFTIYVLSDPGMAVPPQSQTVQAGTTVTFTVTAAGTAPFTYQWQYGGTNIPGATATSLVLPSVQTNQSGPYAVVVSNAKGSVTNPPANLTVLSDLFISSQPNFQVTNAATGSWMPAGGIFNSGERVFCAVSAGGLGTITYQWQLDGRDLPGQTASVLALAAATNLAGAYTCVVSNTLGHTLTSTAAMLSVNPPIPVFQGYAHDLQNEFSSLSNPTTHDWQYSEGFLTANQNGVFGGVILPSLYIPNWNQPDFGPGQPGWQGGTPGAHAGYARRVDNGTLNNTPNGNKDAPVGTIMTHGPSSVLWTAAAGDPGGLASIAGGIWNLRHFGRGGTWSIWMNDTTLLTSGPVNDAVGSSDGPMSFENGDGGANILRNITYHPGDSFRLDLNEGDFQGIKFTVFTQTDPIITTQPPESLTAGAGATINFSVVAGGTTPLAYQWQKDGVSIPGANSATLTLSGTTVNSAGRYVVVVSNSKGSIASYPTLLTVDAVPPALISATRDLLSSTVVTVRFSKPLNTSTATNANAYAINNGVVVSSASLNSDGVTVRLTTSPVSAIVTNVLTVNGVQDLVGNSIAADSKIVVLVPSDLVRLQDSGPDHLLVLEAENYNQNLGPTPDGNMWLFTNAPLALTLTNNNVNTTFSGAGVMEATPNLGNNHGSTPSGPELDYKVFFVAAGSYSVWVRGAGDSAPGPSANDSILVGIDGTLTTLFTGFPLGQGYYWGNTPIGTSGGPIVVPTPGLHVINVWMREDGFAFDKLLLTSNPSLVPTAVGPPESALLGPTVSITRSGTVLLITWSGGGVLQRADSVTGTFVTIPDSHSPFNVEPSGTQAYYRVAQ